MNSPARKGQSPKSSAPDAFANALHARAVELWADDADAGLAALAAWLIGGFAERAQSCRGRSTGRAKS